MAWIHGSILPCVNGAGWWWMSNGVENVFVAHIRPLNTKWALFECHITPKHCCCPCASLMATVYPFSNVYFKQDYAPCHKASIISIGSHKYDRNLILLQWPAQSSDLSSVDHLWDEVERKVCSMNVLPKTFAATMWCYQVSMNQNLQNVLWIHVTKNPDCSGWNKASYARTRY